MSTIKSSDDHLVLNAEGTAKDTKIQTNGTDLVTVKSTGNVGIGTASPAEKLEIYNGVFKLTGSNGAGVRMTHGNTENGGEINLLDTNGAVKGLIDYVDADDDGEGTMRFLNLSSTTGEMEIGTNGANVRFRVGGSEKLRILPTGGITFNGDTAAANALDDYEEGTFTPVVNGETSAGVGTYTKQHGSYVKVGNLVHLQFRLAWSAHTGTGYLAVEGFPYTSSAVTNENNIGTLMHQHLNFPTDTVGFVAFVADNWAKARFYSVRDNLAWSAHSMETAGEIICSVTYEAS